VGYAEGDRVIANDRPFFLDNEQGMFNGSGPAVGGHIWNAPNGGGYILRLTPAGMVNRTCRHPGR